jgi:hypothetical protein
LEFDISHTAIYYVHSKLNTWIYIEDADATVSGHTLLSVLESISFLIAGSCSDVSAR